MTRGATFSFLFHALVVLLAFFGLPLMAKPEPMLEKPILVDIVTIAKVTNLPPPTPKVEPKPEPKVVEPTPKPEPPKPEPPKPEPPKIVEAPPPPPPPPPPAPPKVVEPKPEPPKPEPPKPVEVKPEPAPKVAELKPEPPKPEPPKIEPPKPEPPKPVARVEPPKPAPPKPEPPKPQVKKDDTFDRLLKDLATKKPAPPEPTEAKKPEPTEAKKPEPPRPQQQAALTPTPNQSPPPRPMTEGQLTLSELDAIRSQIAQCWNVPAGARDARNLVVEVQVDMNPDATVRHAQIVDQARMMTDPFFRAAAESAMRAVLNPRCNPLRLPREKFDTWKSFTLNFNPKEML